MLKRFLTALALVILVSACSTSPTGRNRVAFMPAQQMSSLGAQAFAEMRQKQPVARNPGLNAYVNCVARQVVAQVPGPQDWEVTVFQDESANAFALPGGKIGVYTGLLEVARDQHQLAAVIAHEVAHVLAEHANERMSTATLAQAAQVAGAVLTDNPQIAQALGLGARYGVLLPYSRLHESEADELGLMMMARAGFNPQAAVQLWRNMAAEGGAQPPEFLSTHPSHGTRIDDLQARMSRAMAAYQQALAQGRRPDCR